MAYFRNSRVQRLYNSQALYQMTLTPDTNLQECKQHQASELPRFFCAPQTANNTQHGPLRPTYRGAETYSGSSKLSVCKIAATLNWNVNYFIRSIGKSAVLAIRWLRGIFVSVFRTVHGVLVSVFRTFYGVFFSVFRTVHGVFVSVFKSLIGEQIFGK